MQALIPDDIPDQGASLCGNYRPDGEGVVVALRRDGTTRARSARRRDEVCAGKLSVAALGTMIDIIRRHELAGDRGQRHFDAVRLRGSQHQIDILED